MKASEARAAHVYQTEQARQALFDKVALGLANYAVRKANKGILEIEVPARTTNIVFGHRAYVQNNPAVYDAANAILADQGLSIMRTGSHAGNTGPYIPPSFSYDLIKIHAGILDVQTETPSEDNE